MMSRVTGGAPLEIRLLGRFAALRNGAEVPPADFGGRKVRALVRVLATRPGQLVTVDAIADCLWPDRLPADPAANVQVLVNRARRALGDPSAITTGTGGYALSPHVHVDAESFAAQVEAARRLDGAAALRALTDALSAWRGDPLTEDTYAQWADEPRQRLWRLHQETVERAAQLAIELGDPAALDLAASAADAEPLREVAVLTLVRALTAAGDHAGALARYDEFRRALRDELGVDPSPDAAELYQRLVTGDVAVDPPPTLVVRRTTFSDLPFVGRRDEVRAAVDALGGERGAVVLVSGTSGSGKSRTIAAIGTQLPTVVTRAYFSERSVSFALLRTLAREVLAQDVTTVQTLPTAMRAALNGLVPELEDSAASTLDGESRRALLSEAVYRLLETVSDVALALDDVQWADATSLAVLATAHERIPAMRLLLSFRSDELAINPAAMDFITRLHPSVHVQLEAFTADALRELVDDNLVEALLDSTDRTPMAVTELLHTLADQMLIVRGRNGRWQVAGADSVDAARDLGRQGQRRSIAYRVQQQPVTQRLLLDMVALGGGELTAELLAEATQRDVDDVLAALSGLLGAGLVRVADRGWTIAHDMVAEVVTESLDPAQSVRVHARLGAVLEKSDDAAACARHWHAAGDPHRSARAFARAARAALDAFADPEAATLAADGLAIGPPPDVVAELHETRGQARSRLGDLAGAREDLRTALAAAQSAPDRARLMGRLALLASGADDIVRASELVELAVVEAGTEPAAQALALEVAAMIDMNLHRTDRFEQRSSTALSIYQRLGDANGTARVLDVSAMATFLSGDVRAGGAALRRAADLFEDSGDLVHVMTPRSTAGHALVFGGATEDGLTLARTALRLARDLGHAEGQAYALWHCAEALAALGQSAVALEHADDSLRIATSIGHRGWTATAWRATGIAHASAGDLDHALHAFERSLAASEHLDLFASWAAARAALTLLALHRPDDARPLVERALHEGPALAHYEARLARAELAVAIGHPEAAELARVALELAAAGGVAQGNERLAELAARTAP